MTRCLDNNSNTGTTAIEKPILTGLDRALVVLQHWSPGSKEEIVYREL
jgi:hypothetical protein